MVGEIKNSGQMISPISPQAATTAFAAAERIGASIRGIGQAGDDFTRAKEDVLNAEASRQAAEQNRRDALDRSRMQVKLITTQHELGRSFEEMRREFPEDNEGFTAAVEERTRATIADLQKQIPDHLRKEFEPRFETMLQAFKDTAFRTELAAQDASYVRSVEELTQLGIDQILSGAGVYESWADELEELLSNSPLGAAETATLAEEKFLALQTAEFTQRAIETAGRPENNHGTIPGATLDGDVNATGLTGQARGFLNSVAGLRADANYSTRFEFQLKGKGRPNKPDASLLNVIGNTVEEVFGPGATVVVTSGQERSGEQVGSNRHRRGIAADFHIIDATGVKVKSGDRRAQRFLLQAAANGILGIGYGPEYMGDSFHMDLFPHEDYGEKQGPVWGSIAAANRSALVGVMKTGSKEAYQEAASHPGGFAGRYSISKAGWDRAKAALGLTDFGAANQDRAAWWLANERYAVATGGRNLQVDLQSADPLLIEQARQTLVAEDADVSFPQLAELTSEAFYRQVTMSQPTLPDVVYDKTFADIPFTQRVSIFNDALSQTMRQQSDVQAKAQAAREGFIGELQANIKLGNAGLQDIDRANEQFRFTAVELESLVKELNTREQQIARGQSFALRMTAGNFFFDGSKQSERDVADIHSQRNHMPVVAEQDAEAFKREVLSEIDKMQYIPLPLEQQLSRMRKSADQEKSLFAYAALAALYNQDPTLFEKTFGEDITREANYIAWAGKATTPEAMLETLRTYQDPKNRPLMEEVDRRMAADRKENFARYTGDYLVDKIAGVTLRSVQPLTVMQKTVLEREYSELVKQEMFFDGDVSGARERALEILKTRTGVSNLGSRTYFTRRPAENYYPKIADSYEWMEKIVRDDLGLEAETDYKLVSDHITESELANGKLPSYMIYVEDDLGNAIPVMQQQKFRPDIPALTPEEDDFPARKVPARIRFDLPANVEEDMIAKFLTKAEERRANEDQRQAKMDELRKLREELLRLNNAEGHYGRMTNAERRTAADELTSQINNFWQSQ